MIAYVFKVNIDFFFVIGKLVEHIVNNIKTDLDYILAKNRFEVWFVNPAARRMGGGRTGEQSPPRIARAVGSKILTLNPHTQRRYLFQHSMYCSKL